MDVVLGGVSASAACVLTNPLEVVKTRMQLQGELRARGTYQVHYRHVFHALFAIGRVEGLRSLQRGLAPGLLYQFTMNGVRLGAFSYMERRGWLASPAAGSGAGSGSLGNLRLLAAGAVAGLCGAALGSPLYLVKTHLQTQSSSSIAVGHQYTYTSASEGLLWMARRGGVRALWRGVTGAMPRVAVGSSVQLATFTAVKPHVAHTRLVAAGGWLESLVAAATSSVAVVVAMTPLDVVSTRLYNQPAECRVYRGFCDCLVQTARTEGLRGLYKGLGACYFRLGPHTVLSLLIWDEARKAAREAQLL